MSAQTTQPDATHLFLGLGDLTGEIEHQAVLDGENHAHIAPGRGIRADHRVQIAILTGAFDQLADNPVDSAIVSTDTACDIGIARVGNCLKENTLSLRIGFDRGTIVIDDVFEDIKDILLASETV